MCRRSAKGRNKFFLFSLAKNCRFSSIPTIEDDMKLVASFFSCPETINKQTTISHSTHRHFGSGGIYLAHIGGALVRTPNNFSKITFRLFAYPTKAAGQPILLNRWPGGYSTTKFFHVALQSRQTSCTCFSRFLVAQ